LQCKFSYISVVNGQAVLDVAGGGRAEVLDVRVDDAREHRVDVWVGGGLARIRVDGGKWQTVELKVRRAFLCIKIMNEDFKF